MARKPAQPPEMPVAAPPSAPPSAPDVPAPPDPAVGDLLNLMGSEPQLRAGVVSDDPFEVPPGFSPVPGLELGQRPSPSPALPPVHAGSPAGIEPAVVPPNRPRQVEFLPPGQRWETRIEVIEAYQYPGNLATAPEWIDRSWIGYADPDIVRGIPAGPCLRVPTFGPGDASGALAVEVRVGDYVVQQEVKFPDRAPVVKLEVWMREHFEAYFMPAAPTSSPPRTAQPSVPLDDAA